MRRTSIITIVLLVMVIIGLTVALVYTNLSASEETQSETAQNSQLENNTASDETVTETPTEVSLDSDIVADMYKMVNGNGQNIMHYFKTGSITVDDLDNEDIQTVAYYYQAIDNVEATTVSDKPLVSGFLTTENMDNAVRKVFGDIDYDYTYACIQTKSTKVLEYDEEAGVYYQNSGFGGGGDTIVYTAISNVEEYSDRYEVTEKLIVQKAVYTDGNISDYKYYSWYSNDVWFSGYILSASETNSQSHELYSSNETAIDVITEYYNDATEYKHTFMKNEDGTYYWAKTEIVK